METKQVLYPLRFHPYYKEKLWGGQKLRTVLGKDFGDLANCGETWEISGVKGHISIVKEGALEGKMLTELIEEYQGELLGKRVYSKYGNNFPLLVKFIDANDDLSIQVHPDDELAMKRHDSFGKTEMWYIMQADQDASLISGFNKEVSRDIYEDHFNQGKLIEILNREIAEADDVFFLPAGRVHTIGKGLLLAEIQQTSDITYRIYDFDRVGADGKKRELHVEEALDAIDYRFYDDIKTTYQAENNKPVNLAKCPYFETNRLNLTGQISRNYTGIDSFVIYVVTKGEGLLTYPEGQLSVSMGDAILLPSSIKEVSFSPNGEMNVLEAWVPEN
ncbi:MAG: class I mannose-6-phosphate isomerase [Bacteroidia bacterium]|nr:class I mannose-6-phosphate isomerase [Bacteroidia bacterium]